MTLIFRLINYGISGFFILKFSAQVAKFETSVEFHWPHNILFLLIKKYIPEDEPFLTQFSQPGWSTHMYSRTVTVFCTVFRYIKDWKILRYSSRFYRFIIPPLLLLQKRRNNSWIVIKVSFFVGNLYRHLKSFLLPGPVCERLVTKPKKSP